jgi:predicted DNA-binding transcriptional regulator YafY
MHDDTRNLPSSVIFSREALVVQGSRPLAIMLALQSRGLVTARELADELEVSVRTIHRDIADLGAAGVPVFAVRGRNGGFRLIDGWRTSLTGLTGDEAVAVPFAGVPEAAQQLGLGAAVSSAQRKLLAALPERWQGDVVKIAERFHLDLVPWHRQRPETPHVSAIAAAVWADRRIWMRYESWSATTERTLDPFGLVLKAGSWYLVARGGRRYRTYRLSAVLELRVLDETFRRPPRFDLAAHWKRSTARFEADLFQEVATVRVSDRGLRVLQQSSPTVAAAISSARPRALPDGWFQLDIPIESITHASDQLLGLGDDVEVLAPTSLRQAISARARRLARYYDPPPDPALPP